MTSAPTVAEPQPPLQPLLDDAVIALRAPTQVWSGRDGDLGDAPIDGIFHGDVRHVRELQHRPEFSVRSKLLAVHSGRVRRSI